MPKSAVPTRKLVLSRETVRALSGVEAGPALVTTRPSDRLSCETADC